MDESKAILVGIALVMGALVLVAVVIAVYARSTDLLDAQAPVVESCVKHPATRPPFRVER